jgi:hypothetical protein
MTCDIAQNRLLALPPNGMPDDLRAHLSACELCRRFQARAIQLDAELAALPAPAADAAKAACLEALLAAGPVITSVPIVPSVRAGRRWPPLVHRVPLVPTVGLAAAVLLAVGLWLNRGPKPPQVDVAVGPRHELLHQIVTLDTKLACVSTPQERIPLLTEMALALTNETGGVYKAAKTTDEMRSLAGMFEQVVRDGIVKQAGRLNPLDPVAQRHQVLTEAADALAAAARDAATMAGSAPPQVKGDLERIARAAEEGRRQLLHLREGA